MNEIESKLKGSQRLLVEYASEEAKIGLKEIPFLVILEKLLVASSNNREIQKKELSSVFKDVLDNTSSNSSNSTYQYIMKAYMI